MLWFPRTGHREVFLMHTVTLPQAVPTYEQFPGCGLIVTNLRLPAGTEVILDPPVMVNINGHETKAYPLYNEPETFVLFRELGLPDLVD
jgi:hypothetical protein